VRDITERKKAEEAKHNVQAQLKVSMDLAKLVHWEYDVDTDLFTFDDQFFALYGSNEEKEGGQLMSSAAYANRFIPPEEAGFVAEEIAKAISTMDPNYIGNVTHTIIKSDGERRIINVRFGVVKDASGRTVKTFGANQDITERKRLEEALSNSEQKYRTLVENAPDGIGLTDLKGRIIWANPKMLEMFRYDSPQQIIGLDLFDLFSDGRNNETQKMFQTCLRDKMQNEVEFLMNRRDDTTFPAMCLGAVLKDTNGNPYAVMGIVRDITERKREQQALHERQKKYYEIFNQSNDAIFVHEFDENGAVSRFIEVNDVACQMLYYNREELLQMKPTDIFTGHHEPTVLKDIRTKGTVRFETAHHRKDGSILPVEVNSHEVEMRGRKVAIAVVRDITERRRLEETLRKTNTKLGILNSITRHDMLNQLIVLNGFIGLGKDKEKDAKLVAYFEKMDQAASNLKKQIDFAKDYQELGVKAPDWVSVSRQTTDAFDMLHHSNVTLEVNTDDVEVLADYLTEKVPYNLIDNSLRHGKRVTHIKMSAEQVGDAMLIVYQDDGAGIDQADREHLFEKGFGKNSGLGLFLIREILAITGITIEEKGQFGKGVRFEMLVPAGFWRRHSA
jgi:PAS domain S-box-containing protein